MRSRTTSRAPAPIGIRSVASVDAILRREASPRPLANVGPFVYVLCPALELRWHLRPGEVLPKDLGVRSILDDLGKGSIGGFAQFRVVRREGKRVLLVGVDGLYDLDRALQLLCLDASGR